MVENAFGMKFIAKYFNKCYFLAKMGGIPVPDRVMVGFKHFTFAHTQNIVRP